MQIKIVTSLICLLTTLLLSGCFGTDDQEATTTVQPAIEGNVYERPYSPSLGTESAKVTIVEFFDPACEACRAFYPVVKEIMARHPNDIRVVLRYATFHQGSETVVRMLEAARLQNKFEPVLEALLKDQHEWASHGSPNLSRAWEIAESAGLDIASTKAVMNSKEFDQILAQERADIRSLKVSQTPTFFVNKKTLSSFGAQQLYDLVMAELKDDQSKQ